MIVIACPFTSVIVRNRACGAPTRAALSRLGASIIQQSRSAGSLWRSCRGPAGQRSAGTGRSSRGRCAAAQEDIHSDYESAQEQGFVKALLLAWFGSQGRSLFAAKCFVEAVVDMYRAGYTVDDVKLAISLAGMQYGGQLLTPLHEDLLLSWVALAMMTLKEVGVAPTDEGAARLARRGGRGEIAESTSRMTRGLQQFVKQVFEMYLNGTDLYRLQLAQSMAGISPEIEGGEEGQGPSPAVQIMQQNTRLVIITLEVVKGMRLPTDVPLLQLTAPPGAPAEAASGSDDSSSGAPFGQFGPVGFIPSFLPQQRERPVTPGADVASVGACALGAAAAGADGASMATLRRAAAVRLLVGFMGAAMGWLYPAWDFIDSAADCYQLGWTADELFTQLKDEEFAQSGGVLPVGIAGMSSPQRISASLFANWLSLIYMTLAQLGVPFPGAGEQVGWAWVCSLPQDEDSGPTGIQAQGIADFVSKTLQRVAQQEAQQRGEQGGAAGLQGDERWAAFEGSGAATQQAQRLQQQEGFAVIEDPNLAKTSGFALLISQQISLVHMTRQRVLAAMHPRAVAA